MSTIDFCPTVKPTEKEFSNFLEYVTKIEAEYSENYGMVKVVPPKGWKPRTQDYEKSVDNFLLQGPIE